MGSEDCLKGSFLCVARSPCEIDDDSDRAPAVRADDAVETPRFHTVEDVLQAIIHAVRIRIRCVSEPPAVGL